MYFSVVFNEHSAIIGIDVKKDLCLPQAGLGEK